jgi:ubiquinone/menaquinone biosynthesis C-methylase UbiE
MLTDKELERDRYDQHASALLNKGSATQQNSQNEMPSLCVEYLPLYLQAPYVDYLKQINDFLSSSNEKKSLKILEIGAGTGGFTATLLKTGAQVYATDISAKSLEFIKIKYAQYDNLICQEADIELLPHADEFFDLVVSSGVLSYGDNEVVLRQIYRVLKKNGAFIAVDSLNENWLYKANRYVHYLRKNRSKNTLTRMPTIALTSRYASVFGKATVQYFGAISWLAPVIVRLVGLHKATEFSDWFDRLIGVKKSAFKFVMMAKKVHDSAK